MANEKFPRAMLKPPKIYKSNFCSKPVKHIKIKFGGMGYLMNKILGLCFSAFFKTEPKNNDTDSNNKKHVKIMIAWTHFDKVK